jgi:2,4-dienoyl-CoA reductase-like NADH-dependent reductase (Old Yellow Enzyme family)
MPNLFDTLTVNKLKLRNRFIRSATCESLGDQGKVTDPLLALYRELAGGEIGLIIIGGLYPKKDGQVSHGQLGAHTDETIPGLKRLVRTVHENASKIAAQLMHSGWNCRSEVTGLQPVGPTSMVNPWTGLRVRELSGDEIYELAELFIQSAGRVVEAGFDAIQLHAAHSHIISSFLSPVTNKRQDEWGGSPEKRSNFLHRIYSGIRELVGPDYPILVKLGLVDYHAEGKQLSEGVDIARSLEADGVDAIEVSEGLEQDPIHHIRLNATSPYYVLECHRVRRVLHLPLILVGGMRELQGMQMVLDEGIADAISMCRPFIMDPHIVRKFREGSTNTSQCTSCNGCLKQGRKGSINCILR